jgi:hypothetical protein
VLVLFGCLFFFIFLPADKEIKNKRWLYAGWLGIYFTFASLAQSLFGFGTIILSFLVVKVSNNYKELFIRIFLIIILEIFSWTSPGFVLYVFIASLFCAVIYYADMYLDKNGFGLLTFIAAFIFGIAGLNLLSIFSLVIISLYWFRNDFRIALIFFLFALIAPIILSLFNHGACAQTKLFHVYLREQLNFYLILITRLPIFAWLLVLPISIYVGMIISNRQELYFSIGCFLSVVNFLTFSFFEKNFSTINASSSVLMISIPFLIMALEEYKVDWYLGKVLRAK